MLHWRHVRRACTRCAFVRAIRAARCVRAMYWQMVSQALVYRAGDYQQGAVGGRHQQVQAREDHDTYAKAQDCAHIQPEGP